MRMIDRGSKRSCAIWIVGLLSARRGVRRSSMSWRSLTDAPRCDGSSCGPRNGLKLFGPHRSLGQRCGGEERFEHTSRHGAAERIPVMSYALAGGPAEADAVFAGALD